MSTPATRFDHESKQLGRRVTELACQQMRGAELDLTASELLVLRDLFMNGRSSISDTVNRSGLVQSGASTSVADARLRHGQPDPNDGRETLATATQAVKLEADRRRAPAAPATHSRAWLSTPT